MSLRRCRTPWRGGDPSGTETRPPNPAGKGKNLRRGLSLWARAYLAGVWEWNGGGTVEGCLVTPARSSREEAASRALPRRPRPDAGRRSCLGRPLLPRGPEDAFWLSRSGGHQLSAPLAAGICWASRPSWWLKMGGARELRAPVWLRLAAPWPPPPASYFWRGKTARAVGGAYVCVGGREAASLLIWRPLAWVEKGRRLRRGGRPVCSGAGHLRGREWKGSREVGNPGAAPGGERSRGARRRL